MAEWDYGGHKIRLDDHSKRFYILDWDAGDVQHDTFEGAKAEIDRVAKIAARQSKVTMRVQVLAETGKSHFVKGFHMKHANKLYQGDAPNEYSALYPPVAWIKAKLLRMQELRDEIARIEKLLKPHKIETSRSPWRDECKISVSTSGEYAETVERFCKYVADKANKAEAEKPETPDAA